MKRMFYLILLMLLVSCSNIVTNSEKVSMKEAQSAEATDDAYTAAPPMPAVAVSPKNTGEAKVVMTRDYARREETHTKLPFNFVYLPHRPTDKKEIEDYSRICEVWKSAFPLTKDVLEIPVNRDAVSIIPLYWPVVKVPNNDSCNDLIANYDYANASYLVSGLKKFNISKRQLVSIHETAFITLDLSKMFSLEHLTIAFDAWRMEISKRPTKGGTINPYTLVASAKDVLGALSSFITLRKNT